MSNRQATAAKTISDKLIKSLAPLAIRLRRMAKGRQRQTTGKMRVQFSFEDINNDLEGHRLAIIYDQECERMCRQCGAAECAIHVLQWETYKLIGNSCRYLRPAGPPNTLNTENNLRVFGRLTKLRALQLTSISAASFQGKNTEEKQGQQFVCNLSNLCVHFAVFV